MTVDRPVAKPPLHVTLAQEAKLKASKMQETILPKETNFVLPDKQSYPDIFDRSLHTLAATFGKSENLSYFTAVQRIASFMDSSSRLKRRHLMDLIQYIKCCTLPPK
jgi:hypothetical protein